MNPIDEIQLSDDLHDLVADQPFTPDLGRIESRARRHRRRTLAARSLAGVTVLGVAAAGGVVATAHTGASGGTSAKVASPGKAGSSGEASPAKAETVAYVRKQITSALSPADSLIKIEENTSAVGESTSMFTNWLDPKTGNTVMFQGTGSSRLTYWEHDYYDANRVLHWDQTQVNYGPRTWFTYNMHAAGPIQGTPPPGPADESPTTEVKQLLADKNTRIVGHPYVDGHRTVELALGSPKFILTEVWADAQTYQMVQTEKFFPPKLKAPPIKAGYTYVARTAAMTKLINHPQIPAGFRQVPYGS